MKCILFSAAHHSTVRVLQREITINIKPLEIQFRFWARSHAHHAHTDHAWQGMLGVALRVLRNHPEDNRDGHEVAAPHSSNPRTLGSLGPTVVVTHETTSTRYSFIYLSYAQVTSFTKVNMTLRNKVLRWDTTNWRSTKFIAGKSQRIFVWNSL